MSDPSMIPEPGDLAKVGGGLGAGSFLALLLSRIFGGQDKVIGRLDALQVSIGALTQQVAVMASAGERATADMAELKADNKDLRERVTRLEARIEQLSEGGP